MRKLLFIVLAICFIACEKENQEPAQEQPIIIQPSAKCNVDKLIGNWRPVKYTSRFVLTTQPEWLRIDNTGTEWRLNITTIQYYQSYTIQSYNEITKYWVDGGNAYIKFIGDTLQWDKRDQGLIVKYLKY